MLNVLDKADAGNSFSDDTEHTFFGVAALRVFAVSSSGRRIGVCRLTEDLGDVTIRCEAVSLRDSHIWRRDFLPAWLDGALAKEPGALTIMKISGEPQARDAMPEIERFLVRLLNVERETLLISAASLRLWACGDAGASPDDIVFAALRRFGPRELSPAPRCFGPRELSPAPRCFGPRELSVEQAEAAWLAEIGYHLQAGLEGSTDFRRKVLRDLQAARTRNRSFEII